MMFEYRAPDGTVPEFVYSSTAFSFTMPASYATILYAYPEGAWEQCALIYVGGYLINRQLGTTPDRPRIVHLYALPYPQWVTLTGWHKEGGADSELPWFPSQSASGPGWVAWRDTTSANAPYDDLIVNYRFEVGRQAERFDSTTPAPHAYQVSTPTRAYQVAEWLSDFSALADAGRTSLARSPIGAPERIDGWSIDEYLAEGDPREPGSDRAADLLASELVRRGHMLQAGSLRDRLLDVAQQVIRRSGSGTKSTAG